jgi:hypothetical protein
MDLLFVFFVGFIFFIALTAGNKKPFAKKQMTKVLSVTLTIGHRMWKKETKNFLKASMMTVQLILIIIMT